MPSRALVLFAALGLASTVSAQRLYVDASAPGGNGLSWVTAFSELRNALSLAANDGTIAEIWVAQGTYTPTTPGGNAFETFGLRNGLAVYGGFAGGESALDQRDPAQNVTVLSGDLDGDDGGNFTNYADNSWSVVTAIGVDDSCLLDGFTIRGGSAAISGGGIRLLDARPVLRNLIITENDGRYAGGGIWIAGQTGQLTVYDSVFTSNRATSGGAIGCFLYNIGGIEAILVNCVFENNRGTVGGACNLGELELPPDQDPILETRSFVLENCRFTNNVATTGGAIRSSSQTGMTLEMTNCRFESNQATVGGGMSITARSDSFLYLEDCDFTGNSATSGGGAELETSRSTTVEVVATSFTDNVSCRGGGLYLGSGHYFLERCRFERNGLAGCDGGALYGADPGTTRITDSSFFDNLDRQVIGLFGSDYELVNCTIAGPGVPGEGLWVPHTTTSAMLDNCIVWGQKAVQVLGSFAGGNITATHSDVRFGANILPGVGNINTDPLFVDAANGDLGLQPTSPCLDAGNPASPHSVSLDVEGDPRFVDGDLDGVLRIDMGADELDPLHLDITGTIAPGGNIQIDLAGAPQGLTILAVGTPGGVFSNRFGPLFLTLGGSVRMTWPAAPSSVPLTLPLNLPPITLVTQVFAFDGLAGVFSNPVYLELF